MTRLLFISAAPSRCRSAYRNADGDEVYFIHKGRGVLQSGLRATQVGEETTFVIPKGTNYRVVPGGRATISR